MFGVEPLRRSCMVRGMDIAGVPQGGWPLFLGCH